MPCSRGSSADVKSLVPWGYTEPCRSTFCCARSCGRREGAMRIVRGPRPPRSARVWARAPSARRGEAGERVVRAALAAALDDQYVLVHDLYLPGGEGDVDAVLIGPRVLALEIASYAGDRPLRVRGLRWEYLAADERWVPLPHQPSVRAETGARRVAYALRRAGLPAYGVAAIVALVGGVACTLGGPRVPVR